VVPAKKDKGTLMLAMSDPLDIEAIDEIRFITGLTIKPSLALESEIRDAIKKYYDNEEIVRKPTRLSFLHQGAHSAEGQMEIIHDSGPNPEMASESGAASSILSRDESRQAMVDDKIRIDALITLLIEKGLISRDELVNRINLKKMGI